MSNMLQGQVMIRIQKQHSKKHIFSSTFSIKKGGDSNTKNIHYVPRTCFRLSHKQLIAIPEIQTARWISPTIPEQWKVKKLN